MDATGAVERDELGSIIGFLPDPQSARLGIAADGLLVAGMVVATAALWGANPWVRFLAVALIFACVFARPSGSIGSDLSLAASASIVGAALLTVTVAGRLATTSGISLAFLLGGVAAGGVGLALAIVDRRRDRVGWVCHEDGLHRTDAAGEVVTRFAWSEVATLHYRCRITTVPIGGEPVVTTAETFDLELRDGARWTVLVHATGVPTEIHPIGRPHDVSAAILAGIGDNQIGPANQAIDSGGSVSFGKLSVAAGGVVTASGPVPWPDLLAVRIDDWSANPFYNPHTDRVERFIRIVFELNDEAQPELTVGDWQLPNLPTLLRLLRQQGKLA